MKTSNIKSMVNSFIVLEKPLLVPRCDIVASFFTLLPIAYICILYRIGTSNITVKLRYNLYSISCCQYDILYETSIWLLLPQRSRFSLFYAANSSLGQKHQYILDLLEMIWMMPRRGVGGVGWKWTGHTGGKAWIGGTAKLGPLTMSLMSQSIWRYHQIDKCYQSQALPMDRAIHLSTRGRSRGNFERYTWFWLPS